MTDLTKVDVRTAHRFLQKDLLTKEEHQRFLAELPDLSGQAAFVDYERLLREEPAPDRADGLIAQAQAHESAQAARTPVGGGEDA
jgi:hypothetical protein